MKINIDIDYLLSFKAVSDQMMIVSFIFENYFQLIYEYIVWKLKIVDWLLIENT